MKRILFFMIMAAMAVACNKQPEPTAYLDGNGDCIFENGYVSYRINGASNPVITNGMEAILKAEDKKEVLVKDRKSAVAASMNDGGSAIVVNDSLVFPLQNFNSFEVEEAVPEYVKFTITYPKWLAGKDSVSLKRTVILRNRSYYAEIKDVYSSNTGNPVTIAVGFAKHAVQQSETGADYMINWENLPDNDGMIGTGIVMPMSNNHVFDGPQNHAVAYFNTKFGRPVEYAIGSCWSKGEMSAFDNWADMVRL